MATQKTTTYYEGIGRRKQAVARVRITENAKESYLINDRALDAYFPIQELQALVQKTFSTPELTTKFSVEVHVRGGGMTAQAEAIRLGIARALVSYEGSLRKSLKEEGYLRRDPRVKERKKFGLRKARRAPQWSKR